MIIVTGGAGFIGSAFVWKLNEEGLDDIVIVDHLGETTKWKNLVGRRYRDYIAKEEFLDRVRQNRIPAGIEAIVHMGACSSTTERDADYLMQNNFAYTRELAGWAVKNNVRFIYASSAATYGDGALGFSDDDRVTRTLRPINMYGYSKHLFDMVALGEGLQNRMAGIKFFNVFGPNEYHKEDMRSVVHKSFGQVRDTGRVSLFKSHRPEYTDGGQMRDFVYVKDCVKTLYWLLTHRDVTGIFNLGTGKARSWNDLVTSVFSAMGVPPRIDYIEMPESIRGQYQYFTEAAMSKLRAAGYAEPFASLEEAVRDYVVNYLQQPNPYL